MDFFWEGEGLGPKKVEGKGMERVNPFMDKAGGLRARSFPEGAVQSSGCGAEKAL